MESPSFVLLLSAQSPKISLARDNQLISSGENAIVWQNPTLVAEIVDSTVGVLDVSGNVYVCGNISGEENINIAPGEIIYISESDFEGYIKGIYKISFEALGGTVEPASMNVFYGATLGDLPTPIRDYYTFVGWYTAEEGGEKVSADTTMSQAKDLILYAHWDLNEKSDWVLASDVPAGAEVVDSKWSYTLREYTTDAASTLSGWTKYDTKQTGWGAWSAWGASNPTNGVRNVESRSVYDHTEYHYYRWTNSSHSAIYTAPTSNYNCNILEEAWFTYELPSSPGAGSPVVYNGTDNWANRWVPANFSHNVYNGYVDSTFTRAVNRTEWRYQEPVYTYYFHRDLSLETFDGDPTGQNNVSNVQKWVRYRAK